MTKNTLKFIPDPEFTVNVQIPVAGLDEPGILTMTFIHQSLQQFQADDEQMYQQVKALGADYDKTVDVMAKRMMKFVSGWAFPEPFTEENVQTFIKNYPRACDSATKAFVSEMMGIRDVA